VIFETLLPSGMAYRPPKKIGRALADCDSAALSPGRS
jgi:hypothetical protein